MSEHIHKAHGVSALLYHLVCPTKYRRAVITDEVDAALRGVCFDISSRFEIEFIEIGADRDHVHFLVQSVPTYSPSSIAQKVKSITTRAVFRRMPSVKGQLWGSAFWSSGYYVNTVGRYGSEAAIRDTWPVRAVGKNTVSSTPSSWSCFSCRRQAAVFPIPRSLLRPGPSLISLIICFST